MPDSSNPVPEQSDWDDREILWERKAFYVVKTPAIFGWPLNLEQSIEKTISEAHKEGYQTPVNPMVLFSMGLCYGEVLVEVSGVIKPSRRIRVFNDVPVYTALTEASERELRKITREFSRRLREQGKRFTEIYYWMKNYPNEQENTGKVLLALEN